MNSYQKRKEEIKQLELEVNTLKRELISKGNIFFVDVKWLGSPKLVLGTVIDGELTVLPEG